MLDAIGAKKAVKEGVKKEVGIARLKVYKNRTFDIKDPQNGQLEYLRHGHLLLERCTYYGRFRDLDYSASE